MAEMCRKCDEMIIPDCKAQLDYSAKYLVIADGPQWVVVGSQHGDVTILDSELSKMRSHQFGQPISALAVHPSGEYLSVLNYDGHQLIVADKDFNVAFDYVSGTQTLDLDTSCWTGISSCLFTQAGELWTARHISSDSIEFQIRSTVSWSVRQSIKMRDPIGMCTLCLSEVPQGRAVVACLEGGPRGELVCWLLADYTESHVVKPSPLRDKVKPVFHPGGHEFLALDSSKHLALSRMSFPECGVLGMFEWPFGDMEGEPGFGNEYCYLTDTTAIVIANEGRLFAIDLECEDRAFEELILQGQEPKPCEELYSNLSGNRQLIGNTKYIRGLGADHIVSLHERLPNPGSPTDLLLRFKRQHVRGPKTV